MTDPVPAVRMRGVQKCFGEVAVLRGLDLDVPAGQRLAIIGPSGSGKSTILRLLMTLERPDGGRIEVEGESLWTETCDGREVPASAAHQRRVRAKLGMVFQLFHLFPHMDVLRNVTEAPRRVLGLTADEAEARARELLAMVGLEDRAHARPAQLSGGQKQRVAIARALAMQPRVLLFDEVTSALDPELVGEVLAVLRRLARETDVTMLLVTHQMGFAAEFADRVAFLDGGVVVEDGPAAQVLREPREPRTQAFLRAVLDSK